MNLTRALRATGRRLSLPVVLLFSVFMLQPAFAASNVQGGIDGQVVGPDGNAISGATVTITSLGTGLTRSEQTEGDGEFGFSSLPVGTYSVTVDAEGFPQEVRESVGVNIGVSTNLMLMMGGDAAELAAVTVTGAAISPIDIGSVESATILGEQTIDRIPVGRNLSSVALLAPGTTRGDTDFGATTGTLASFGGATVGENVCYINGLNVTNFRNGLGCSTVPFEFYQEFNIKTGGYSAEFGRATGGAVSAVTKSGTNEYKYSANLFYTPFIDGISGEGNDSIRPFEVIRTIANGPGQQDDELVIGVDGLTRYDFNSRDEVSGWDLSLSASGPIVKDKAFFYVLYNPRNQQIDDYNWVSEFYLDREDTNAFYGAKLDWYVTNNHLLELTAFSDQSELETVQYDYDPLTDTVDRSSAGQGALLQVRGGDNVFLKYTGYLTPDFTLSVGYGINEYSLADTVTTADIPRVDDAVNGGSLQNPLGGGPYGTDLDERVQTRIDAEWFLGDHTLRFGIDDEKNTSTQDVGYTGGFYYAITTLPSGGGASDGRVERSFYSSSGEFETNSNALYIEDTWQVTDTLVLNLGVRNTSFENTNGQGEAFIEIDNQIAPRLGFSWDALGDGTMKVYGTYGRYFLPVPSNTNIRLTGGEVFLRDTFEFDGSFNADGTPVLGDQVGLTQVFGNGLTADPRTVVDQDIDPMYQDELILGVQKELDSGWSVGTRVIFRDLKSTIEDITVDNALEAMFPGVCSSVGGCFYYVLTNPGEDVSFVYDANHNGAVDTDEELLTLTGEDMGYPPSERYYNAVEFLFERAWDGVWFMQGSYTWSQSYGSNEGFVRSDNDQNDAGLTTLFDFPGLLDGAYGYLPNDRRHRFKLYGAWQFADHWQVGANVLMESGRPVGAFGNHPTDQFAVLYGSESFYAGGNRIQRGSYGTTPFTSSVDLSLKYMTTFAGTDMTLGVDVFNIFNATNTLEVRERIEEDRGVGDAFAFGPGSNVPDVDYGLGERFQAPRSIRLSAQFDF